MAALEHETPTPTGTMRAMVQERYGPADEVLRPGRRPIPEVGPDTILVRVEALSINAYDWHMVGATPAFVRLAGFGFRKPKNPVPGYDLAGVVVAVGEDVTSFAPGDRVFGWNGGTAAEFVAVRERQIVKIPEGVDLPTAASMAMAGFTALQGVRDHGGVDAGDRVLVLGASGGVGQLVVQIAKSLGAHVTGVCGTHNVDTVRRLGADEVVDYSATDVYALTDRFDVVIHVGGEYPLKRLRRIMADDGVLVLVGSDEGGSLLGPARFLFAQVIRSWFTSQRVAQFTAHESKDDLEELARLLTDGELVVAIDHTAPLEDLGKEITYLQAGHATGKVVIEVGS